QETDQARNPERKGDPGDSAENSVRRRSGFGPALLLQQMPDQEPDHEQRSGHDHGSESFVSIVDMRGGRGRRRRRLSECYSALRDFCSGLCLLACVRRSSNSPTRAAAIKVSMTVGSLSFDATVMAAFPFSNSTGLPANRTVMKVCPTASVPHQGLTRWSC